MGLEPTQRDAGECAEFGDEVRAVICKRPAILDGRSRYQDP